MNGGSYGMSQNSGVKNIILSIYGIFSNILFIMASFLPTKSGKYFFWTYISEIIKSIINLEKHWKEIDISGRTYYFYYVIIDIAIVGVFVGICVIACFYLVKCIVALCCKADIIYDIGKEGKIIFTLSLLHMIFIYSNTNKIAISGWLYFVLSISLLYLYAIFSFTISLKSNRTSKVIKINFICNFFIFNFSSFILFLSSCSLFKLYQTNGSNNTPLGIRFGLYNGIFGIITDIKLKYTFGLRIYILMITVLSILIYINVILNMLSSLRNIEDNEPIGSTMLMRTIYSMGFLIVIEILSIICFYRYKNHVCRLSNRPTCFFIAGLVLHIFILFVFITKRIVETTKNTKRTFAKSDSNFSFHLILMICITILLFCISIGLGFVSAQDNRKEEYGQNSSFFDLDYIDYDSELNKNNYNNRNNNRNNNYDNYYDYYNKYYNNYDYDYYTNWY